MADLPIPIGRSEQAADLAVREERPHLGLVFERFPRVLERDGSGFAMSSARHEWLTRFIELSARSNPLLSRYHQRLDAACAAMGGERHVLETRGRLAIGLGNPNAAEIGFALDHATGLPVIPGSSLKGLARAGARLLDEEAAAFEVLGSPSSPDAREAGRSGTVILLDALPETWPPPGGGFEIDVVTRHHDPGKLAEQKTPLDTDEPSPVHFLVVTAGVRFVIRLLPRRPGSSGDVATAWRWLERAGSLLGAGGKTAVGYGEMRPTDLK